MGKLTYQELNDDLKPTFTLDLDVDEQHAFILVDTLAKVSRKKGSKGRTLDPHGKDVGSYVARVHRPKRGA